MESRVLREAIFVGIFVQIFFSFIPPIPFKPLVAGILLHIIWECLGLNKWYCKNGNACQVPAT